MPWCSSPMAPGWNVSLPNGGCSDPVVTTVTQPTQCEALLTDYMRMGWSNSPVQMTLLKTFLNSNLGTNLSTGDPDFDLATFDAVFEFQTKYFDEVLAPWEINEATGFVYKTTLRWINMLHCSTLNLPIPELF